eukprot:3345688-Amphidinium_carterae.1
MELRQHPWEEVKRRRLAVLEAQVLKFYGIDNQGGFGPEKVKMAGKLAKAVASNPEQCVPAQQFMKHFTPRDVATAVRARGAHCIYVHADGSDSVRYCAASNLVHKLLKTEEEGACGWKRLGSLLRG